MRSAAMTKCAWFGRVRATDATSSSTPSKPDVLHDSQPSGAGVLELGASGVTPNNIIIVPYGRAANGTFTVYVYGWDGILVGSDNDPIQWHASLLCQFDVTLSGALTGVAGGLVTDSDYYADEVAAPTVGNIDVDCKRLSPAGDQGASYMVDVAGYRKIEIVFKVGTATHANAIVRQC